MIGFFPVTVIYYWRYVKTGGKTLGTKLFSTETAQKLAEKLQMPMEYIAETPPEVMLEKISQLEEKEQNLMATIDKRKEK